MTIASTVWQPQFNQEGDYDQSTAANLTDPVTSTINITDPVSSATIINTGITFTQIATTTWSSDDSN